jgi:type IV pilus assembly protein PilY1
MRPRSFHVLGLMAWGALLSTALPGPAGAATPQYGCYNLNLEDDWVPPFAEGSFQFLRQAELTPEQTLRATPPQALTSAEHLVLPVSQRLSATYVQDASGTRPSLGYLYVDELMTRGYLDVNGNLLDTNGNGITDLHEDLYNLAPATGSQARPYVGTTRRCTRTFTSGGFTYSQPDLALNESCTSAFTASVLLPDARPGSHPHVRIDVVGSNTAAVPRTGYSDNGLYARIPNLLEPAHALNNARGLGHPVFFPSGGEAVDLGTIDADRELVFFLVVANDSVHNPYENRVYPCLRKATNGQCTLHLKTSTSVFFSKSKWNLDQDPVGQTPVVARNIGCEASESCLPEDPHPIEGACAVAATGQNLCGWLDAEALSQTSLPMEAASVPLSGNGNMPHVLLGAPGGTPRTWLLAFEDLGGGGDRDFNDAVFQFRGNTGSEARSSVVYPSTVITEPGCAISQVRFRKDDAPGSGCDAGAAISYAVATDCRVCDAYSCILNFTPSWQPVTFPTGAQEVVLDVSSTPGNQLCWKASMSGTSPTCLPTVSNVDVGFVYAPVPP